MKVVLILISLYIVSGVAFSQNNKALFLVHSTGNNLYTEGKVSDWVKNYNSTNGTNFQITTRDYPNTPWPWENYPYDYWKLWVDNSCNNTNPDIECLASMANNYGLVIFKHCFPGSDIEPDTGTPDIKSDRKSLENYKLQYRALRNLMDGMPDKKFMVWTLVPLHRLATTPEKALRANEFVNWVKNKWLTEDGKTHLNIFIFDFYSLAAELKENPTSGMQYCLKYDYEGSHTSDDSHVNTLGNEIIGPLFSQAVIKAILTKYIKSITLGTQSGSTSITTNHGTMQMQAVYLPADATNKTVVWSILNITGKASVDSSGLVTAEKDGTVKVVATANDGSGVVGSLDISISSQNVLIESISIVDNLAKDTINGVGTKIPLKANITPQNATNKNILWSVENITGKASIDNEGVLTTSAIGKIKVTARAADMSSIYSTKEYTIVIPAIIKNFNSSLKFMAYGNRINGSIRINIDKIPDGGVVAEIRNILGVKIIEQNIQNTHTELILDENGGNLFFITLKSKNGFVTKKVIL